MQKRAPTRAQLAAMAIFALSCFALLLYLWKSFGGPVPLGPEGYRVQIAFEEAPQLSSEADVRISGVTVGRVAKKELDRSTSRLLATLEIDTRFAPLPADTRATLRTKTIIGETYVELSPGDRTGPSLPEGARLPDGQVQSTVQLDEVLGALDGPVRRSFQQWQQDFGRAVGRRGADINATVARLPIVASEASDLLRVLDQQETAVRDLVDGAGTTFRAVARDTSDLRGLVTVGRAVFATTGARRDDLAETVRILPTFLDETRATLNRLEAFSVRADPVIRDLRPAFARLRPTTLDLRALAPDLQATAERLDPLIAAAGRGLPALAETLRGLRPVVAALEPALAELNPVLEWLEYNQRFTAGLFNASAGINTRTPTGGPATNGRLLRAQAPSGLESIAFWSERLPGHRGNAYLSPSAYADRRRSQRMILPSFDCANTGRGEFTTSKGDTNDDPSCWTLGFPGWQGRLVSGFPRIERADYRR